MSRETITFATRDEAGEVIEIHEYGCRGHEDTDPPYRVVGCTCSPMTLVAGAMA